MRNRWLAGFSALLMALGLGALMSAPAAQAGTEWGSAGARTTQVLEEAAAAAAVSPYKPIKHPVLDANGRAAGGGANRLAPFVYQYAYGDKNVYTTATDGVDGISVFASQHFPYWDSSAAGHSLFEITIQGTGNSVGGTPGYGDGNIVELGWTREAAVCGTGATSPCLFASHWYEDPSGARVFGGYGKGGYVDNPSEAVNAAMLPNAGACSAAGNTCGTALAFTPAGSAPTNYYRYQIKRQTTNSWNGASNPGWRVIQNNFGLSDRVIGVFPDTIWTSQGEQLPKGQYVQAFYEVVHATDDTPCTDMGSGLYAVATTPSGAARVNGVSYFSPPAGVTAQFNLGVDPAASTPNAFRVVAQNGPPVTQFTGGGPGFAGPTGSASTAAGAAGSC